MAVADVLRPLDGAEAQFTRDGRRRLSTAPRKSGRHQAGAAPGRAPDTGLLHTEEGFEKEES